MKITAWLAGSMMLIAAGSAQAFTAAPVVNAPEAQVIQVAGGCGFGEHRGPLGGCRLNNGPRGAIRAAVTGAPRGCPPGRTRAPNGACYRS